MKNTLAIGLLILGTLISLSSTHAVRAQEPKPVAAGTPVAPAGPVARPVINAGLPHVSPDGSRIAFVSHRGGASDLFVISANGTGELQLTHTPEHESPAGWTRDGTQVLFSVAANEASTLYAIGRDGTGLREVGRFAGRGPMPSPDGKRVVYMAGTWTATKLMVLAMDGTNPKQITDGSSIAWNSHWSPDGRRIAFTGRADPKGELAIFVLNADGTELRQLTQIASEEGGAQWPVWSPDGKHLAIQVNNRASRNSAYIWIVNVATGDARKLGVHDHDYLDETPAWFPDGRRIAFQSNRTGRMEIRVMNADGSGQTQVTGRIP